MVLRPARAVGEDVCGVVYRREWHDGGVRTSGGVPLCGGNASGGGDASGPMMQGRWGRTKRRRRWITQEAKRSVGYGWDLTSGDVDTWGPRGGGARIEWMYICREAGYGGGKKRYCLPPFTWWFGFSNWFI